MEPNSRSALLVRARIEQQIGQPQFAADLLRDHLKAHPQDRDAHQLLGRALQRLGRSVEAAPHLELGQGAEGIYGDPWSNAIDTLQTHFAAALRTASELLGENPQRAVEKLQALHEERPENATALTNLGIGYRRLGRLEDSLMALKEVVQRHPGRGLAHFHLAATCLELLRIPADSPSPEILQSAFRHIDRALGLQPTVPRNHALHAEILVLAGRTPEAIQAYTQAVAREPIDLAWLPRLGTLLCELHRFREAISVLERHRRRAGDSAEVLLLLGVAKANTGHLEEAAETLEQARLLSPHNPSILQALERLRKVQSGLFSQAIDS
jgi:Flp pilus assembly protein TadD